MVLKRLLGCLLEEVYEAQTSAVNIVIPDIHPNCLTLVR